MPKKKKTREQKILADMRHKAAVVRQNIIQPQLNRSQQSSARSIAIDRYQYVYSDLVKTVVLTISIIVGELLLGYLFV